MFKAADSWVKGFINKKDSHTILPPTSGEIHISPKQTAVMLDFTSPIKTKMDDK